MSEQIFNQHASAYGGPEKPQKPFYLSPEAKAKADHIEALIVKAKARYDAKTPSEREAHDKAQRESFVRGMMPTGDPEFD